MFYAGIDAHAQYLQVVVLDKHGAVAVAGKVTAKDPAAVSAFLVGYRPLQVVVETSPFWPWLRDALEGEAVTFHLAHARELRAIAQHAQKNDAVDAHLLARMLLAGLIPPAYAHSAHSLELLRLVRHYAWLTRYRTMYANRIHAQLHQSGIQLPRERLLQRRGKDDLRSCAARLSREQQRLIRTHLMLIKGIKQLLKPLRSEIRKRAGECPDALVLRSIPGIGPYWSVLLTAELTPVQRFSKVDRLISYAGLAPITRATGGHVTHGPLPKAANRWIRGALVAAVMSHVRHAPNSRLSQYYERMKARLGWKKARVAAARRLARIVYSMLRSGKAWRG
jgi:transposase